jgi:CheY-like chemotaxis protein
VEYKILIVEDDKAVAEAQGAKLRSLGFTVETVSRGDEAIPKMKEWMPHLVVLDLDLPGQTGVQVSQQMRFDPSLRSILVVANSTHMDVNGLGQYFYGDFVHAKGEEPYMINKLKPAEGHINDLYSAVGVAILEKFQHIPSKMEDYLQNKHKKDWGKI